MNRVCLAALFVMAALSAHADVRWSMMAACEWAVRMTVRIKSGVLYAEDDFAARTARIEYATPDDHGTFVHHSAQCLF